MHAMNIYIGWPPKRNYNLIFIPRHTRNILVRSVSFNLKRFQRYDVLKNVQVFCATL